MVLFYGNSGKSHHPRREWQVDRWCGQASWAPSSSVLVITSSPPPKSGPDGRNFWPRWRLLCLGSCSSVTSSSGSPRAGPSWWSTWPRLGWSAACSSRNISPFPFGNSTTPATRSICWSCRKVRRYLGTPEKTQIACSATGFSDRGPVNWGRTGQSRIAATAERCRCTGNTITGSSQSRSSMCPLEARWTRTIAG